MEVLQRVEGGATDEEWRMIESVVSIWVGRAVG